MGTFSPCGFCWVPSWCLTFSHSVAMSSHLLREAGNSNYISLLEPRQGLLCTARSLPFFDRRALPPPPPSPASLAEYMTLVSLWFLSPHNFQDSQLQLPIIICDKPTQRLRPMQGRSSRGKLATTYVTNHVYFLTGKQNIFYCFPLTMVKAFERSNVTERTWTVGADVQ